MYLFAEYTAKMRKSLGWFSDQFFFKNTLQKTSCECDHCTAIENQVDVFDHVDALWPPFDWIWLYVYLLWLGWYQPCCGPLCSHSESLAHDSAYQIIKTKQFDWRKRRRSGASMGDNGSCYHKNGCRYDLGGALVDVLLVLDWHVLGGHKHSELDWRKWSTTRGRRGFPTPLWHPPSCVWCMCPTLKSSNTDILANSNK